MLRDVVAIAPLEPTSSVLIQRSSKADTMGRAIVTLSVVIQHYESPASSGLAGSLAVRNIVALCGDYVAAGGSHCSGDDSEIVLSVCVKVLIIDNPIAVLRVHAIDNPYSRWLPTK